jgi:hypothetical protein
MLQRLRESLALVLIALLPFHALLVTVLTKLIAGPGHRPLPAIAIWKEGFLGLLLLFALVEIALEWKMENARLPDGQGKWKMRIRPIDSIDATIIGSIFLAVLLFIFHFLPVEALAKAGPFSIFHFVLGFKYDFLPLIAFLILRRVEWSQQWRELAMKILFADGIILSVYGLFTFFLPMGFFTALGYSDLHSLYLSDGPLAAFQQLGGSAIRRMQSAMSGPNQFGLWMLLPLSVLLTRVESGPSFAKATEGRKWNVERLILLVLAIILSFSRAAWIAAIVIMIVAWLLRSKPVFRLSGFLQGTGIILSTLLAIAVLFPSVFLRLQSTSDHFRRPVEALRIIAEHPLGLGLGSAGPASNATGDTCIDVPAGSDISWASGRQNLCVFVAGVQAQPRSRDCHCPLLTENWYLQWGVEMGWLGLVLSVLLPFFVLRKWNMEHGQWKTGEQCSMFNVQCSMILAFLGVSVAGLFLHSFEDAAVAYSVWISLASVLPVPGRSNASK